MTIPRVTGYLLGFVANQQNRNLDDVNKFCHFFCFVVFSGVTKKRVIFPRRREKGILFAVSRTCH